MSINYIVGFLILLFVIAGIIESLMSMFWVPFYIRLGLPAYIYRFPLPITSQLGKPISILEGQRISSSVYPTAVFQKISQNEVAFRSKLFEFKIGFRIRASFRGIIRLDAHSNTIAITGYLPWFYPFFAILLYYFFQAIDFGISLNVLFAIVMILALGAGVQILVFRHISKQIREIFTLPT